MNETKDARHGGSTGAMRPAVLAFLATTALAACTATPEGGDGRLNVRSLQVRATGADGMVFEGVAVDSTWTIPGADARELTRSLALEPGDGSESPNRLVDIALGALVTGFEFLPPGELADDAQTGEDVANGLLEISFQQGIAFRTPVVVNYSRGEDLSWRGTASFQDRMLWIDSRGAPEDTLRFVLDGDYEDVRDGAGGRRTVLRAQGTLSVASADEYAIEFTERVRTVGMPAERVARRFDDVGAMAGAVDEAPPR